MDKCNVELEKARSSKPNYPVDGEEDLISWFPRDLSTSSESVDFSAARGKATFCSRTSLLKAFEILASNLEDLHKENALLKATHNVVPPTGTSDEISVLIDEYDGKICDLHAEIHQLKEGKQPVITNMSMDSMILNLNLQLESLKSDVVVLKEKNELLIENLESREKELHESYRHVSKLLTAQETLETLTSKRGNQGKVGLGYNKRGTRTNWSPRETTWIREFQRGKYVIVDT